MAYIPPPAEGLDKLKIFQLVCVSESIRVLLCARAPLLKSSSAARSADAETGRSGRQRRRLQDVWRHKTNTQSCLSSSLEVRGQVTPGVSAGELPGGAAQDSFGQPGFLQQPIV